MTQLLPERINLFLVLSNERTSCYAKNNNGKSKKEVQAQGSKVNSETIEEQETDICIANEAQNKILKPTNQKNL